MKQDRISIIDIARVAEVSKSTVSLVLQGSPLVNARTRDKVEAVIRDLGYVYNRSAANLRGARTRIIGVVVNDLTNPFFAELAVGIEAALAGKGFVPFLAHSGESADRQAEIIASMREHGAGGLIISPARGSEAAGLQALTAAGMPVVVAVRSLPGSGIATVQPDNYAGGFAAAQHLLRLGHRRLAFLGGYTDTRVMYDRYVGFRDGLFAGMHPHDPKRTIATMPNRAGGVSAMERALALAEPPTAALCFNDAVAFGACDALRASGREPGRDFAIVGFDDVAEARHAVPALTSVAVDPAALGKAAAELLLRQVEQGRILDDQITLPAHLVVRESCGAGR